MIALHLDTAGRSTRLQSTARVAGYSKEVSLFLEPFCQGEGVASCGRPCHATGMYGQPECILPIDATSISQTINVLHVVGYVADAAVYNCLQHPVPIKLNDQGHCS